MIDDILKRLQASLLPPMQTDDDERLPKTIAEIRAMMPTRCGYLMSVVPNGIAVSWSGVEFIRYGGDIRSAKFVARVAEWFDDIRGSSAHDFWFWAAFEGGALRSSAEAELKRGYLAQLSRMPLRVLQLARSEPDAEPLRTFARRALHAFVQREGRGYVRERLRPYLALEVTHLRETDAHAAINVVEVERRLNALLAIAESQIQGGI